MNDKLRKEVKLLKALQDVSYKEVAELLEVRVDSFYSWLKEYYNFSEKTLLKLQEIITNLQEY